MKALHILYLCQITTAMVLPRVDRSVANNGFHREIRTVVLIPSSLIDASEDCTLVIKELLPSGAYVDPFQLQSLQEFGGPKFVCPHVDIEQPQYTSQPLNVSLFAPTFHRDGDMWLTDVTVPIHLRYHYPTSHPEHEYTSVVLTNPLLLLRCKGVYKGTVLRNIVHPCSSATTTECHWQQIKYESDVDDIQLLVPVGRKQHTFLVVLGTVGITLFGCLVILYKVNIYPNKEKVS